MAEKRLTASVSSDLNKAINYLDKVVEALSSALYQVEGTGSKYEEPLSEYEAAAEDLMEDLLDFKRNSRDLP